MTKIRRALIAHLREDAKQLREKADTYFNTALNLSVAGALEKLASRLEMKDVR